MFKARYFTNTSLFEATRGGGVSFIWSGIWQAKEALRRGFKWVVGDGETIKALEDPWVRGRDNFTVNSVQANHNGGIRVCDLFLAGSKQWDIQKVHNLFADCEAKSILAIPIPKDQVPDHMAWVHTSDGKYSVKSGYRYWHTHLSNYRQVEAHKGWSVLWNLKIPHKARIFLWRLCRNNIPVRCLLRSRGVQTTIMCPMCGHDVEHLLHIFLDCSFAKACWREMKVEIDAAAIESCPEWILQVLSTESEEKVRHIAIVLWGIWMARNRKVWDGNNLTPELAIQSSVRQVDQWREAQADKGKVTIRTSERQVGAVQWKAPENGRVKINVDASVYAGIPHYGVGLIIRDHLGQFYKARVLRVGGEVTAFEAVTKGVLEALKWAVDLGLSHVEVESDSLLTVRHIREGNMNYLEVGRLLQECRNLLVSHPNFGVSHVRKQANKVAHSLARVSCEANSFLDFLSPPHQVLENLLYDAALC